MFLDEIFRPKTGDEVLMSAEDMRQARINRYGTDDITPVTALDYSDKFNTELTPDEEAEFQAWAKENNRERDSYDYDIRGAWKELKSGSMSEDERGHLGDKYKKPNHPTFSDQSVYNGKDGVAGGTWSEVDGKTVFTPGRMLSKREAEHLSDYFKRVEPDVKLNLDGKIIKPKPLPGTGYEPSWFEGIGDSWQGMNAALAETKSSALTVLSELPIGTEEEREGWLRAAEATRAYSKAHYEADPEIMGSATQIIHGLFRSIPKAAGYSAALGPGAGALAFGADIGVNESQKLKDDGVDQNTRTWAGVTSFAANAIGLRLPAAIGGTRLQSTLYGGLANIGTDSAERKGIQFILEQQDYKELARQYDLNSTDMIVSGAFGAFFGAAAWRRPLTKLERDTQERRDALRRDLKATGVYTDEQADVQSGAHAKGEVLFARDAGVDWKDVAYTIEKGDERSAANAFHMPVTQGIEWHAGPTKLSADTALELKVIENTQKPLEQVVPSFQRTFTEGVTNKDTGFKLTASVSDIKKWTAKARRRWFLQTVGDDLVELAEGARLIESHSDVVHGNPEVQGVHKLVNAVRIGDQNLRVVFTVRDYATKGQERTALHSVDNIDFELVETTNPPVNEASATSGSFDGDTVPAPEVAQHPVGPHPFKVTLSQVLGGNKPYVRADGKSYFDPVDLGATVVGGVYYDAPSSRGAFEQAAYHGTAYTFDKFTLDHVGSGEGVQAHGWGLYFSLDRQIAEGYRSRVTSYRSVADELSRVFAGMDVKTREGMAKALYSAGDKLSPATRELLDALQEANWLGHENPMDAVQASLVAQIGKGKQTPRIESAVEGLRNEDGNVGKWIVDLYKSIIGVDAENPVETVVKDRYKQAIGEDLPPLSKQVETVVKRMYGQQERVRSVKPNRAQIVAARVAQSQRATEEKTTAPFKNPRSADAYDAAQRATKVAVEQINDGKPVDVAQQVKGVEMNDVALTKAQKNFARAVQMSDDSSSMVVLQNRDRSAVASIGQMSSIAANPIYSRMSFDRSTGSGAPIVSFGSMPDVRYQGITDYVMDGSERVPVTYAVVEADSVLTSNTWDGRAVEAYGEDSSRVHAVAGNGRMAGLTEAYNRGTAGQYIEDMIADTQMTGIDPQAIKELKRPALVRFIPNEKVTTGFIDRSNQSQVLEMSGKERAVQDAGKLSARRLQEYTFDENGDPTRDTLNRFVTDIGEPSALGSLIDSAGNPTEAAKTRVKAALFYAAYRDPELTSLVAVETDKQGIKRILNAMTAFAPHVINIRESSGGVIDLGPGIVEAVNMIKRGDVPGQADIFGDVNPVAQQIFEIFSANKNSAAEIGRILGGFSDSITQSLGEGSGMLLGDPLDLADAMSYLRQAQNAEIQRLIDEGKTGLSLMPDVDVESIRQSIKAGQDAAKPAENLVDAMGEKIAQDAEQKAEAESDKKVEPEADVDPMSEERARAVSVAGKDADMVRLENLAAEKPDQAYVIDDNGTQMTMEEVFAEMQRVDQEAEIDAAGIGKATECILKNGGIQQ